MNLVERWFAELTNRKLHRSAHRSVTELEIDIRRWIKRVEQEPHAIRADPGAFRAGDFLYGKRRTLTALTHLE